MAIWLSANTSIECVTAVAGKLETAGVQDSHAFVDIRDAAVEKRHLDGSGLTDRAG